MQITCFGDGVEITPALRSHAEDKLQKLIRHFDHGITSIHMICKIEKMDQIAEATIHLAGHGDIHATAKSDDLYKTIGLLTEKLDHLLLKQKEKMTNHHPTKESKNMDMNED